MRRHIVEFDGDLPAFNRARFDQCICEDIRRVLGKLIVCADVPKARSCNGLLFFDADDNLTGERSPAITVMVRRNLFEA